MVGGGGEHIAHYKLLDSQLNGLNQQDIKVLYINLVCVARVRCDEEILALPGGRRQ